MVTLISFILVIIGAINWLSVSLFEFDFVAGIFGATTDPFSRIIYGLVGLAAIILIYVAVKNRGIIDVSKDQDSDITSMHDKH
jgi:uncharacterized membrane protein YuzA (DUF378 family)